MWNFAKVFAMPFLDVTISSLSSRIFGANTFFFADLVSPILLIPLNSSNISCVFSCHFVLPSVASDALLDLSTNILQALFVSFLCHPSFFNEGSDSLRLFDFSCIRVQVVVPHSHCWLALCS